MATSDANQENCCKHKQEANLELAPCLWGKMPGGLAPGREICA